MATNHQWILRRRPVGEIGPGDLEYVTRETAPLKDGEVLVRTVYLSLDPTNRIWMSDQDQYLPPVEVGDVMRGGGIGVVEESRSASFPVGAVVNTGLGGWQSHLEVLQYRAEDKTPPAFWDVWRDVQKAYGKA